MVYEGDYCFRDDVAYVRYRDGSDSFNEVPIEKLKFLGVLSADRSGEKVGFDDFGDEKIIPVYSPPDDLSDKVRSLGGDIVIHRLSYFVFAFRDDTDKTF